MKENIDLKFVVCASLKERRRDFDQSSCANRNFSANQVFRCTQADEDLLILAGPNAELVKMIYAQDLDPGCSSGVAAIRDPGTLMERLSGSLHKGLFNRLQLISPSISK